MAREVSALKVVLHGYFGGVRAKTSTGACVTLFGSNDILQQVFVAVHKRWVKSSIYFSVMLSNVAFSIILTIVYTLLL